jgi:hypothetical protein
MYFALKYQRFIHNSHDIILRDFIISPITGKMEESDPPPPPPNKGGFKGKRVRSRSLSRVQKKHSNNQKKRKDQHPLPEHDPAHTASVTLLNQLEESLASIPSIYRVNMGIVNLYRGTEKIVGATANYHKGDGRNFVYFKNEFHPTAYLYPLVHACGGTRQDLCVEGAPSILMNLPLYLQFLHWRMCVCGTSGDGILATNLYIKFRSIEVVALLRVLSILHNAFHIMILVTTTWGGRWILCKQHS